MELLDRLHLVNRTNIGVPRIYKSLLMEGKEPPIYREVGSQIELTITASNFFPGFQAYIKELEAKGMVLGVDDLLVLQYLTSVMKISIQRRLPRLFNGILIKPENF